MKKIFIRVLMSAYAGTALVAFGGMNATAHFSQCRDHYSLYDTGKVAADTSFIALVSLMPMLNVPMAVWLTDGFPQGISFYVTANCADVGGKA